MGEKRMKTKQIGIGFCVIGVALCVVPWIVHNVQTPAEYYGASSGEDTGLHVSISIDCSRVYGACWLSALRCSPRCFLVKRVRMQTF